MTVEISQQDRLALRRTYLFSGMDEDQLSVILSMATPITLESGQGLFQQGDAADHFFWVSEGMVRLYRSSPQGDEKVIELISPGRFFAEAVLFMGGRYPVNAACQQPSRLIAFDGAGFKAWLGEDANRCFRLLSGMSAKLHKLVNEIDRLTLMKGSDRLMQYLIDHSEPDGEGNTVVLLEAPKQVIASRIGVKPETLSRLLQKLGSMGFLETRGSRVYLKDLDQLPQDGLE